MSKKEKEEPIRIAQIMGKWVGGGVEAVIMNYYRHIDRTKIQFDFLCDEDSTDIPYDEIESLGGKVILIPPYQKVFKYQKAVKKILKDGNYKIVHSHINTLSVFPLRAAKKAEVPIRIAHSHATTNKKEVIRNLIKKILLPFSKLYATNYMCCSEVAGRWLFGNKAFEKGEVIIINNAVDLNRFAFSKSVRDKYRERLGVNEKQIVIGHVGRLTKTKNQLFLLSLFSLMNLDNAILVLIGQGPLEKRLKQKAKKLCIEEKVVFLGQKNDIENWYQAMDVFVLPSLYEGFGMALIEAQDSNLPCIASNNVPITTKMTEDFRFISLKDIDDWKNAIHYFSTKKNRISNVEVLRKRGYDINTESEKLSRIYCNLMEEYNNARD